MDEDKALTVEDHLKAQRDALGITDLIARVEALEAKTAKKVKEAVTE